MRNIIAINGVIDVLVDKARAWCLCLAHGAGAAPQIAGSEAAYVCLGTDPSAPLIASALLSPRR